MPLYIAKFLLSRVYTKLVLLNHASAGSCYYKRPGSKVSGLMVWDKQY